MITVWLTVRNSRALTLVESLISILLLGTLLVSVLATFVVSNLSASRARHRFSAMNIIKEYNETEARAGYDGGSDGEADYYATVTAASPVSITIDDRGTADTADDLIGTITPDPYFPDNVENADGSQITYAGVPYKIVGFVASWNEDVTNQSCSERAVLYVAYHSSA